MTSLLAAPGHSTGSQHSDLYGHQGQPHHEEHRPRYSHHTTTLLPPRQHQVRAHHEDDAAPHHVTCGACLHEQHDREEHEHGADAGHEAEAPLLVGGCLLGLLGAHLLMLADFDRGDHDLPVIPRYGRPLMASGGVVTLMSKES
ncbi:hypothetical protein Krad_2469 [Kineococcus radiotolerans SRS30216 = ATCC BAA-149]|uniref:Uncharacterized protein n=1 Tax=Kineococcus radiotolerans (strain ATCC BAA-149 / DSM 14245 / SRS30216) TaxID=266940 RepID=A6WAV6_KINRD|nr:hypothetical protein Krad_2469 [Kineococcus radiotolerans SRS30216 = ATCC BAA-149]